MLWQDLPLDVQLASRLFRRSWDRLLQDGGLLLLPLRVDGAYLQQARARNYSLLESNIGTAAFDVVIPDVIYKKMRENATGLVREPVASGAGNLASW